MNRLTLEARDGLGVVTFDTPDSALNRVTPELAGELERLLTKVASDEQLEALIFVSGKAHGFVAGPDVERVAATRSVGEATGLSRQLQAVFDRLDAFAKPVVIALDGACLGPGLEWALACDYRLASDRSATVLGLPEVRLGLLPSAGGTQRLPALLGLQPAFDLLLTGKAVRARKAQRLGLIDEVVPEPVLLEVALRRARELATGERPRRAPVLSGTSRTLSEVFKELSSKEAWTELALEENPLGRKLLLEQVRRRVLKKSRGKYPAAERIIDVVRVGLEKDTRSGLDAEATAFGELVCTPESRRLVELSFAIEALAKDPPSLEKGALTKVGIIGGGVMGSSLSGLVVSHQGLEVRLQEKDDPSLGRAFRSLREYLDGRVRRRSISHKEAQRQLSRFSATTEWTGLGHAQLVIEAVSESLELKRQVLSEVERRVGPQTIVASCTSAIPIAEIALGSRRPGQVIGLHYFAPATTMPLLEIVAHPLTDPKTIAICQAVGRAQGKTVIVVNDGPGFYSSRVLAAYLFEAGQLLESGAEVAELDRALVDFGFSAGPAALLDDIGLDVATHVGALLQGRFPERMQLPAATARLLAAGRRGRKIGLGFYRYEAGKRREVDEDVYASIQAPDGKRRFDPKEMAERCVLRLVNEAVRCLDEGVLRSARDGDVGAVFGLGFPPYTGGPFRWLDAQGLSRVVGRLEHFQKRFGARFEPARGLIERARAGARFH